VWWGGLIFRLLKWEVLAENKAVWEQFCKQLGLGVGSLG
jgi:hypothetical protein